MREIVCQQIGSRAEVTGDVEECLRRRLDERVIKRGRLSLAAHLGYPPAVSIAGKGFSDEFGDGKWWKRFGSFGTEAAVRGALALALPLRSVWKGAHDDDSKLGEEAIEIARAWIDFKSPELEQRARILSDPHELDESWQALHRPYRVHSALHAALLASVSIVSPTAILDVATCFEECVSSDAANLDFPKPFNEGEKIPSSVDLVGLAIVSWALGFYDPLQ